MIKKTLLIAFCSLGSVSYLQAQGNIHSPGEGGFFTADRLAGFKGPDAENYDNGNNPWMMDLYNDMRTKLGVMGEEVNLTLEDIDGTIYLDESFQLGALHEDGVIFKRMYMRYDAYNDEIELRESPDSKVTRAMVKNQKYSCSVNGSKFDYLQYKNDEGVLVAGYLEPLVNGGDYVLYQKQLKIFKEGKPAKTSLDRGFPHRFLDKTEYYLSVNGDTPQYFKAKKSEVMALFPDEDQKVIKQFIKEKQIDLGESLGLTNLFAYANTL
ncbi:hypothetical protein [Flagellimonas iocasae]|uniref:Uncharacterized protein n=1 Tax=Flagellimonas iocasae TaxID=2055905 RepID=A0ABW4Y531_9FLAO